jgi:hypothetical protein
MGGGTAGRGHIRQIDMARLPAWRTRVRRGGHHEINRPSGGDIAQGVSRALTGFVARGKTATSGAGGVVVVTAVRHALRLWEVLDVDKALRRVWHLCTRSKHGALS